MTDLHDQFVAEARELIQQASDDLVAAEREELSGERIDRVFRAFHTLKGGAGVVDLPPMGLVLHAAEDLLAAIHAGELGLTPAVIDRLLGCLDQVATWVDDFDTHEALPVDADVNARTSAEGLRALLGRQTNDHAADRGLSDAALPGWVSGLILSQSARMQPRTAREYVAFSYQPRAGCFFDGDDPLALVRQVPGLQALSVEVLNPRQPLASMDPFSCDLLLQGICAATQADMSRAFRLVPDQVRILAIPADAWPPESPTGPQLRDSKALAAIIIEEQAQVLRASATAEGLSGRAGSTMRATIAALRHCGREDLVDIVERAAAAAIDRLDSAPLLKAIDDVASSLAVPQEPSRTEADGRGPLPGQAVARAAGRSLRVEEARIDALVDLAGELLVATHGVLHIAKRAEADADDHFSRDLRERKDVLERISGEIHRAVLQLRMVPVARVFRSFPRVVRDLSQQLGKNVTLESHGETTEADKTIVDLMFEPLMHLVRNALDHGIEAPEQRRAVGKPDAAKIIIRAAQVADRLVVDVADDGRGIDPAMIRHAAAEKGLLTGDELAALSDEQSIDLVFAAGFSTASTVSDISGRGVGMDVVRATIERIGGRISLKSQVGAGTAVTLDFPMNIALVRIMVVETAGQVLGIPMDTVLETVRLAPDRISRFKSTDSFVLHDRVVPICSLAELLKLPASGVVPTERLVVVAEAGGRTTALEVDAIRERLEVVLKPMQGMLSNARGFAGTTLLGDGAVLLVLDLKEILP